MIDYLNNKLGGEFISDPGLLPGILMLIYMVICGGYITRLMYKSSYKEIIGPKEAFILITLLNGILILAPTWIISVVLEKKFGFRDLDASIYHFIGITFTTIGYRKLLVRWNNRKCQQEPSADSVERRDFT